MTAQVDHNGSIRLWVIAADFLTHEGMERRPFATDPRLWDLYGQGSNLAWILYDEAAHS
ncbi:MAG TPA: hypothetical protein VMJ31_00285 [Methylocystis sp.]|nr:hypothetical protein [Methylocystis sp.]